MLELSTPNLLDTLCMVGARHALTLRSKSQRSMSYGALPAWVLRSIRLLRFSILLMYTVILLFLLLTDSAVIVLNSHIESTRRARISHCNSDDAEQRHYGRRNSNNISWPTSQCFLCTWSILHASRVNRITCSLWIF